MFSGFFTFVGSAITTLGYRLDLMGIMLVGRFFFWLALNALLMVQTIIVFDLFEGKDLNCAMTFIVCSIRFGGGLAYPLSGPLLQRLGVQDGLWFTVVLVFGAFVSTLLFAYLFRGTATARAVRPHLQRRREKQVLSLGLVRHVPWSVFLFLLACGAVWGVVFPFEVVGDDMLQKDFGYSANDAGVIIAIAPMMSILSPLMAPFLGSTIRQKLLACATGLALLAAAFVTIAYKYPISGILVAGVGYAVSVNAFYSTMPMLVREAVPANLRKDVQSLVVGINMAGSGSTMIVSNLAIGFIKDRSSYGCVCVYLTSVAIWGMVCLTGSAFLRRPQPMEEDDSGNKLEPLDIENCEEAPRGAGVGSGIEIVVRAAIDDAYYVSSSASAISLQPMDAAASS